MVKKLIEYNGNIIGKQIQKYRLSKDYSVKKLVENGRLDKIIADLRNHRFNGACKNCSDWIYYQEGADEEYVTVYPVKKDV